jgi:hypothetical protein
MMVAAMTTCTAIRAADAGLDINVRTTVELPRGESLGPHPTFAMVPAVEVASPEKLVRPVGASTLQGVYEMLQEKLEAQGYVGVHDPVHPEVLITIQYGRGYLPNPYTVGASTASMSAGALAAGASGGRSEGTSKMSGDSGPTVSQRGEMNQMRRFEPNYESKMQFAGREKLFFTIAAWNFASMQKGAKRVRYWTTTVLVDDPDHRDLNGIYAQMIAASAAFFNRRIDKEEIEVSAKIRDGRVEVGIPRIVEPAPPK